MENSRPDHILVSMDPLMMEPTEIITFDLKARLDRVKSFDITSDQQHFAILDFNYVLHVYKIKNSSNEFEEIYLSKVYDNCSEPGRTPFQEQPSTSTKGMNIPMSSNILSDSLIHLSISDTGKYVALSVSPVRIKFTWISIYSTEHIEKLQNTSIPTLIGVSKTYHYARPEFSTNALIITTDEDIRLFNLNFELMWRTENFLYGNNRLPHVSYGSASNNLSYLHLPESGNQREISYCTKFIRRNVLIEICDDHIQRLWLPGNNKPIASLELEATESIIAISENHKYVATFETGLWNLRICLIKAGSGLYKIELGEDFFQRYEIGLENRELMINEASFQFGDNFLLFSGYVCHQSQQNNLKAAKQGCAFTELWSIPDQRMVFNRKHRIQTDITKRSIIFVSHREAKQLPVTFFNCNNNYLLERECFDISIQDKTKIPVQQLNTVPEWEEWEPVAKSRRGEKYSRTKLIGNDIVIDLDSPEHQLRRFMMYYNNNKYVLLFGSFSVQMWRLRPITDSSVDNDDVFKSILVPGKKSDTLYYRHTTNSELIYIRIYNKAVNNIHQTSEGYNFTDMTLNIDFEFIINEFTGNTIVRPKTRSHIPGSNIYFDDYFDELFLPMGELFQLTCGTRIYDQNNRGRKNDNKNLENKHTATNKEDSSDNQSNKGDNLLITQYSKSTNDMEFHYFESIIRALFYLQSIIDKDTGYQVAEYLRDRTKLIFDTLLQKYKYTDYFSTKSGSHSLYMLSSVPWGCNYIKEILLKNPERVGKTKVRMQINVISHPETATILQRTKYTGASTDTTSDDEQRVNVLTKLSETNQELFFFLFYYVLIDSLKRDLKNMEAITDLFLFLQKKKRLDMLLKCTQMMSYFPVSTKQVIDKQDLKEYFDRSCSIKIPGTFIPFTFCENTVMQNSAKSTKSTRSSMRFSLDSKQIQEYQIFKSSCSFLKKCTEVFKEDYNSYYYQEPVKTGDFFVSDSKILCVVPLPSFNRHASSRKTRSFFRTSESPFTHIASSRTFNNVFVESDVVIEALTIYKWKSFARSRFLWILLVHAIFYVSFSVGVAFAEEVFGYRLGETLSHLGHFLTIIVMFISWFLLLVQEIRQFANNIPAYMSFYNLIDWASLIMSVSSFILLLVNGKYINEVRSTTTLILWIHGILRLRALYTFGTTLELIIQMSLKTMPFIGAFCSVVFAFTHTFIVLLRQKDDEYFQEQFSGTQNDPNSQSNNLDGVEVSLSDASSQNDFTNPFKAFADVWFLIYGVWDPLNDGDAGDNPMITILTILFSFVICLIFVNMIIALMSGAIEEIEKRGRKNWIHHLAAVVAEVELFWCSSEEKADSTNNPDYVYYIADKTKYEEQNKRLMREFKVYHKRTKDSP